MDGVKSMVKSKEIEIVITENGEVEIEIHGVKGKKCIEFSKFLEDAIGEVKERKKTSEYYEREAHLTISSKKKVSAKRR